MTVYDPTNITASPYDQKLNPKRIDEDKINEVVFSDYGITPQAVKAYMYGIRVIDPDTGQEMPDSFYWQVINTQIDKVQKSLDIQILPMLNENERHDYYENDASGYDHINTFSRPILQLGDSVSDDTKSKISKARLGMKCSNDTKRKQSIAHQGLKQSKSTVDKRTSKTSKPVVQLSLDDQYIKTWKSAKYAAINLGFDGSAITKCCKGKLRTHKGYHWEYLKDYKNE